MKVAVMSEKLKTNADMALKLLIRRLRQLEKDWPKGYWLFSANGELYLMREKREGRATGIHGAMDQDDIVAELNIPNDGGDW